MQTYKKILFSGCLLLLLATLSIYARVGYSTLMMADDYCYFGLTKTETPIFDVISHSYTEAVVIAGNRIASTVISVLFGLLDAPAVRIMPAIFAFGLLLSVFLLIREAVMVTTHQRHTMESLITAGLFSGILLYISPSHFQNIYWFSGIVAYSIPIIFYCLLIYLTIKFTFLLQNIPAMFFGVLVIAIFTAGFSETSAVAFFTLTLLLYVLGVVNRKIKLKSINLPAAIVGLGIGILLLVISPSAINRNTGMAQLVKNQYDSMFDILAGSFKFGFDFIIYQLRGTFLPLVVLFTGTLVIGSLKKSTQTKLSHLVYGSLLIIAIVYLSISASMAPQIFAFGAYPNERSQFIPLFILISGISCFGLLAGSYLSAYCQRYQSIALLVLTLASVYVFRTGLLEMNYQAELDARRQQWLIRNQHVVHSIENGERDLIVSGIDSIGTISDFNPVCFREYYQLNSVELSLE